MRIVKIVKCRILMGKESYSMHSELVHGKNGDGCAEQREAGR